MIRVYFDGQCGICRNEMSYYQRIAPEGVFEWLDIMHDPVPVMPPGLSVFQALKVLHAQDSEGKVHKGLDAFLVIWRHLPRFRWLYKFMSLPWVHFLGQHAYYCLAGSRYRWMGYDRCVLPGKEREDKT